MAKLLNKGTKKLWIVMMEIKTTLRNQLADERGVGMVEIALIIIIIIGLAIIFRDQVNNLLEGIFDSIDYSGLT